MHLLVKSLSFFFQTIQYPLSHSKVILLLLNYYDSKQTEFFYK
ncbi:hypothetical protein HPHPM6_0713 [Helicobacter pylori Hp M6]|nr:hypothetical protein HPHPM6_0713 [Helicobacter pylori Hp M6]